MLAVLSFSIYLYVRDKDIIWNCTQLTETLYFSGSPKDVWVVPVAAVAAFVTCVALGIVVFYVRWYSGAFLNYIRI